MKFLITKVHDSILCYGEGYPSNREIVERNAGKSVVKASSLSGKLNDYQMRQIKSLLGVDCPTNEKGYTYFNLSAFDKTGDLMEKAIKGANENDQLLAVLGVLSSFEGKNGPSLQIKVLDAHRAFEGTSVSVAKNGDDVIAYIEANPGTFDFAEREVGSGTIKSVPVSLKFGDYDKKQIAYNLGIKAADIPVSDKGYTSVRAEGWNKTGEILEKAVLAARENNERIGIFGLLTKYEGEKLSLQLNTRGVQRIFNNKNDSKPAPVKAEQPSFDDLPDDPISADDDLPF